MDEPSVVLPTIAFEASTFGRSDTPPMVQTLICGAPGGQIATCRRYRAVRPAQHRGLCWPCILDSVTSLVDTILDLTLGLVSLLPLVLGFFVVKEVADSFLRLAAEFPVPLSLKPIIRLLSLVRQ